jgi:hypothetical protein
MLSPFMTLSLSASLNDAKPNSAATIFGPFHRVGIEVRGECTQRRRLEDIDAKRANCCGIYRVELTRRQRRGGVALKQFSDMCRHRA